MKYIPLPLLLFGLFCVSCQKLQRPHDPYGQTAFIPLGDQITTLDPANAYDSISLSAVYQSHEQLYEYHYLKRPYTLQPLLAEKMPQIDPKGTQYTIKVKQSIPYHDDPAFQGKTRYVKAIDFIHQIKRIALTQTKSNGWFLFKNMIKGLDHFRKQAKTYQDILNQEVSGLRAPDDSTLVIQLTRPYPQFQYILAMSFASPVPYEVIDYYKNDLSKNMVGSGPFKLIKWNRGLNLLMTQNPNYRHSTYPSQGDSFAQSHGLLKDAGKKIPFLSKIEFKIMKESQTQWLNFLDKKIDYLSIPKDNFNIAITPRGNLSPELKGKNISLQIMPTLTYWWVAFNMRDPILGKNLKLRQAIAHAIDIKRYLNLFTNNIGKKANSIFVPGIAGYDPKTKPNFEFNLDKAKQLIKDAGFPNGKNLPRFTYNVRGSSTFSRQQGEYIKNVLEKIGLKIDVVVNTFPGFLKKMREGKLQIWTDGWALDYPDAENITQLLSGNSHPPGPNHSFYKNPEVDQLIKRLKVLPDGQEKFSLMKRIEKNFSQDLPWVLLYYRQSYLLYQNRLKNFRKSSLVHNDLKYIKIE